MVEFLRYLAMAAAALTTEPTGVMGDCGGESKGRKQLKKRELVNWSVDNGFRGWGLLLCSTRETDYVMEDKYD